MFQLEDHVKLKLRKASPRKENHGEELVQAIDLDLEWETSADALAMFSGHLRSALYWRESDAQQIVEGVDNVPTNLRLKGLEFPLKWDLELKGRDFIVVHGLGGKSDLTLATTNVKKFRITAKEGGTVVIGFQVQADVDVSEKIVGKLCALEGESIEATLTASEVEVETDGAGQAALV